MPLPPIAAIEIGTTKVRALIGEAVADEQLLVTGAGEAPSRGIRKGDLVHFDNALACARSVLEMAADQAKVEVYQAHLVISGGHIQGVVNRGNMPIFGKNGEITDDDIKRVADMARALMLPPDRDVLHTIPQHYYVDDMDGVIDPVGMAGAKLALDMLILHGSINRMRNLARVVSSVPVDIKGYAFAGLCAALAVTTKEQKDSGVIVIDIGGGTTDYLVYADKAVAVAGSLGVGGDHVTNDIAIGFNLSLGQAERLKVDAGNALVEDTTSIDLPPEAGFSGKHIRLQDLDLIINARMDEILNMVKAEVTKRVRLERIGAGVVLTGGTARMRNLTQLAGQVFRMPAQIGTPKKVSGLAAASAGPEYAVPLGMLLFALRDAERKPAPSIINLIFGGLFTKP